MKRALMAVGALVALACLAGCDETLLSSLPAGTQVAAANYLAKADAASLPVQQRDRDRDMDGTCDGSMYQYAGTGGYGGAGGSGGNGGNGGGGNGDQDRLRDGSCCGGG